MLSVSKETKISDISCALLMGLSSLIHLVANSPDFPIDENIVIFLMYSAALLIWIRQINRRIISAPVKIGRAHV